MFLKVLNYRIHNALGTDPIPEPAAEGEKGDPSVLGKGEDLSPETGHTHSLEAGHTHTLETGHTHSPEEEEDDKEDSYEHSGSTLNEGAGPKSDTPTNTPSIELSTMSNDVVIKPTAEVRRRGEGREGDIMYPYVLCYTGW